MIKTISLGKSRLSVDMTGGKIQELILNGVKVLGTYDRVDGKKGATHVCVPNFVNEGMEKYGLPSHGPARALEWEIVKEDSKSLEMRVMLEALGKYASALEVSQKFILQKLDSSAPKAHQNDKLGTRLLALGSSSSKIHFHHEVIVKNIGTIAVPVNIAIHNYFDTPYGWKDAKLNKKSIKKQIEKNTYVHLPVIAILRRVNSIQAHDDTIAPSCISHLAFGASQSLAIETVGAQDMMCWTSVKGGKYNQDFACVEPVISCDPNFFGSEESMLQPGELRRLRQTISLL